MTQGLVPRRTSIENFSKNPGEVNREIYLARRCELYLDSVTVCMYYIVPISNKVFLVLPEAFFSPAVTKVFCWLSFFTYRWLALQKKEDYLLYSLAGCPSCDVVTVEVPHIIYICICCVCSIYLRLCGMTSYTMSNKYSHSLSNWRIKQKVQQTCFARMCV